MTAIKYLNFDLRFERLTAQTYRAQAVQPPAGEGAAAEFAYPFSPDEQTRYFSTLLQFERKPARAESSRLAAGKDFGQRLFGAVFQNEMLASYRGSLEKARAQGIGLRLRLNLQNVPELAAMPWEYLYDEKNDRFLANSTRTPVVRYFELPESVSTFAVTPPLNILVATAQPLDKAALNGDEEMVKLQEAFQKLHATGLVNIDHLPKATIAALHKKLNDGPYHIFHFIGHGKFDENKQEGQLIFEDESNLGEGKCGAQVGTILRDHESLRLVMLNACEGASAAVGNAFAGCAQRLVQHGLPAVIAMQCPMPDASAILLAETFYGFLALGYPVDGALSEARKALFNQNKEAAWAAPVLFMRSTDGRIFQLAREKSRPAIGPSMNTNQDSKPSEPEPNKKYRRVRMMAMSAALIFIFWFSARNGRIDFFSAIPTQKHLAVLPLTNVGNDPLNQAFCDGLFETLTSRLSQIEPYAAPQSYWVVPAAEVRERQIKSPSEAKQKLGANLVITGSVQRDSDKVILTLNLCDATGLRQLETLRMSEHSWGIADLQDKAALRLAQMLKVDLQNRDRQTVTAGGTANAEANALYLRGHGYFSPRSKQAQQLDSARALLQRATALDPRFVLAYAGLGEVFWKKYEITLEPHWIVLAEQNCQRALELNVQALPARVTLAQIYNGTGRYEQALAEVEKIFAQDPVNAGAYRLQAFVYENLGRLPAAEATYKRAIALRPEYYDGYNQLGVFYFNQGRYAEAMQQFQSVVGLTPENTDGHNNLGGIYYFLERYDDARAQFNRSLQIAPNYEAYSNLAEIDFMAGDYAVSAQGHWQALQLDSADYQVWGNLASAYYWIPASQAPAQRYFRRAVELAETQKAINPRNPVVWADLAEYYAHLDERLKAREHIRRALEEGRNNVNVMATAALVYETIGARSEALQWVKAALANGYTRAEISREPGLKKLREDERFKSLLPPPKN